MSRSTYVEISCDNCGQADYLKPGNVDKQARDNGWIVTVVRKDFCDKACKEEYKSRFNAPKPIEER